MREKYIRQISGGTLINYKGNWTSGADYEAGDYVLDSGAYLCIAPHVASTENRPPNLTYWVPLGAVITSQATAAKLQDTIPQLEFVDGGSNDAVLRLNAGILQAYDNVGAAVRAALNISTGDFTLTTPKTDCQVGIPISPGVAISGTWTPTSPGNVLTVTRTAAAATTYYRMLVPVLGRITSGYGLRLKSVSASYVLGGTIDTSNDNLELHIIKQSLPANGSASAASILAGDDNADYDANHNTKALRLASGNHTLTVTIPSGERAYVASGEQIYLDVLVADAATANLTFAITGAVANFDMALY